MKRFERVNVKRTLAISQFLFLIWAQMGWGSESQSALDQDLERIVSATSSTQWFMDQPAYEEVLIHLMPSLCRVLESDVLELLNDLQSESKERGEPDSIYAIKGVMDDEVEKALNASRKWRAIQLAHQQKVQCPFWVKTQQDFKPRQSGRGRMTVAAESGGLGQIKSSQEGYRTGGGGAARVFAYYGLSSNVSVLTGFGFGGGAFVDPQKPEEDVDVRFFTSLPLVLRLHQGAWHGDLELAPVSTFNVDNYNPHYGWRVGTMIGFSTLRVRNFLPWAGIALAFEHFPHPHTRDDYFVKFGFRAGTLFLGDD